MLAYKQVSTIISNHLLASKLAYKQLPKIRRASSKLAYKQAPKIRRTSRELAYKQAPKIRRASSELVYKQVPTSKCRRRKAEDWLWK